MRNLAIPTVFVTVFFTSLNAQFLNQQQKLIHSDRRSGDHLGAAMTLEGSTLILGAPGHNDTTASINKGRAGAVYIYQKGSGNIWTQGQKLMAQHTGANYNFGASVAISSDHLLIGSPYDNTDEQGSFSGSHLGSVYFYKKNTSGNYTLEKKLVPADLNWGDSFGYSLAMSGNKAFITAPFQSHTVNGSKHIQNGAVYIYEFDNASGWTLSHKLLPSNTVTTQRFGSSISFSNGLLAIGAEGYNGNGISTAPGSGSVYIFEEVGNQWIEKQILVPSDVQTGKKFGFSLDLDGDQLIIGSPYDQTDQNGNGSIIRSGSVYFFEKDNSGNWNQVNKIVASNRGKTEVQYGYSVSVKNGRAAVGANNEYSIDTTYQDTLWNQGLAYIIQKGNNGWNELQKLHSYDLSTWDHFGSSVMVEANSVYVGAIGEADDVSGLNNKPEAGSVYSFENTFIQLPEMDKVHFEIYPNPSEGIFTVMKKADVSFLKWTVYNNIGQKVKEEVFREGANKINLKGVPPGVYSLHLSTKTGVSSESIVIQ